MHQSLMYLGVAKIQAKGKKDSKKGRLIAGQSVIEGCNVSYPFYKQQTEILIKSNIFNAA